MIALLLFMQLSAQKAFSARARASALAVRRHQQALGPSEQLTGMANPKIRARVAEILAEKQAKGKKKAGGKAKAKGKKAPDPAKAKAKADREKAAAAKKVEREKAKAERAGKQLSAATARETAKREREKAKVERTAAQAKKQAAQQKKLKQAAHAKRAKDKASASAKQERTKTTAAKQAARKQAAKERLAAQAKKRSEAQTKQRQAADDRTAKQNQAQQHKTRVLSEKIKRGEKLSASDQVDAEDAGLVKRAGKALDLAIKQSDEERAMFAKMGGGRGKGKGYDKKKSKLTTHDEKDKAKGGSGAGSSSSVPTEGHATGSSGGGPGGRATLRAPVSGDMEAHARFVEHHRAASSARADVRSKARANIEKIDAIQKELKKRNTPIARLRELQQQLSDIRSGKAIDMDDLLDNDTLDFAIKAGARHSKMDASHLDEAARHLHAAGATCPDCAPDEEDDGDEAAGKAIKGIMDNPAWYAQHECSDIMQAGSALSTLAMLIQSELSEEDEDDADVSQLCDAARTLIKFIESELDELEGAAGDAAAGRTAGDVPMAKATDDAWLHMDGGEIKAVGDDDAIKGLAVLYATKATHDLEKDYYDRNTDLWLDHWGWPRPITYHHGMDAGTRDDPVVGHWTKATVTDEGVWLEGQLDRAHRYYKAVKELARRGYLKISSDSGPQWVIREPQTNGANYIKRWPLVSASVTVTPMEPRMFPVEVKAFLAELGYEAIETEEQEAINPESARSDGTKADDERARRILLELDILQLEETAL